MAQKTRRTNSRNSAKKQRADDYVSVAIAYGEEAAADIEGRVVGKWVRLAAKRFLSDLERVQREGCDFVWSPNQANEACWFLEQLPHVEGVWETPTIRLEPSQVFFVVQLFGFRRVDGSRRFSTALYAVARKNAKSALAAGILLYVFCTEPEMGPQVLSAATTGDQARIVWSVAKRMVQKLPDLCEHFTLEAFANAIARYEVGGTFKPINAKASTQDGLNPSALCFDELHAHKTRDLFDVLRSAAGARKSPLFLYTTTEGYENGGPWHEVRSFAKQILDGAVEADHFLAVYYALDDGDDDFDETKWVKANPLLGVSVSIEKLREYATEAKRQPGALAEFRIKRLNRQSAAAQAWIDLPRWQRCEIDSIDFEALQPENLGSGRCWAAFDLASTRDMTAWRLLWLKDDHWYTAGKYWVPKAAVAQRTSRGGAAYASWVEAGHIIETEGDVTDYAAIERDILADFERFKPIEIAFDPWNASDLANRLIAAGLPLVQFPQGTKSYHPGMQALERAYIAERLHFANDPVLTWNAANVVPRRDVNLNMAPDKKRSPDKIDGMACLLMAFARATLHVDASSAYEQSNLMVI